MRAVYFVKTNANHKLNIIYFLLLVISVIIMIIISIHIKHAAWKVKFDNQESSYVSVYDYFLHVSSCHINIAIF